MIRVLIADDEPLARDAVRMRLADEADITVVGEACDGVEAVEKIVATAPDLVFLDVAMPGLDGFDVIERVAGVHLPMIVFVSAYDHFAIRAFEVHAVDYVLKPFEAERLRAAVHRVRDALGRGEPQAGLLALLDERLARLAGAGPAAPDPWRRRFVVRERQRFLIVRADDVECIEAAGNYACLHTRDGSHLVRETMSRLAESLDPQRFARVHRSAIVAVDRVREVRPGEGPDYEVVLDSGRTVRMSRTYRDALLPPERDPA